MQAFVFAAGLLPLAALPAGDFTVAPIRLELDPSVRTGAFTVRNDGSAPLSLQVRGMEWSQDQAGQDKYEDAKDLVYFPRLVSVEPGQEALIRVGVRQPATANEKTYRLFIEELPGSADSSRDKGAALTFLVRFGAPVFVKPPHPVDRVDVEAFDAQRGKATFSVHNAGTQHQLVESVLVKGLARDGQELFAVTLTDRYLLAGTRKQYSVDIPRAACERLVTLQAEIKTDKTRAGGQIPVGPATCA